MRLDRQLLQGLLDTWKNIKEIRRSQRCTNTSVRLIIKQYVTLYSKRLIIVHVCVCLLIV